MYCRNCGNEVSDKAVMCVACGTPPMAGDKFCYNCKAETNANTSICMKCGVGLNSSSTASERSWGTASVLCFFFGWLGAHRFYTGHIGIGLVQMFTFGGFYIWWIIDLIMLLTKKFTDKEGRIVSK